MLTASLAFLGAVVVLKLWNADFSFPFAYEGDARGIAMLARDLLNSPDYLNNAALGWPDTQHLADIPQGADNLTLAWLWLIGTFTGSFGSMMNVYFVATFVAVAVSAYAAIRLLHGSRTAAVVAGTLYTFLPYHFARGEQHLLLAGYYMVPLAVVVILWQTNLDSCLLGSRGRWSAERKRRVALTIGVCVALGMTSAYYAAFFVFLLVPAGLIVAWASKSRAVAASALTCASITVCSVLVNVLPTLVYWVANGRGTGFSRIFGESEIFGLKISSLFLPVPGHRITAFAKLTQTSLSSPIGSEIGQQLGLIPAAGLLMLLLTAFVRLVRRSPETSERDALLSRLSLLAIISLLVAAIGGFSSLAALAGVTFIRVYSRFSVVLGFLGLMAFVIGFDALRRRWAWTRHPAALGLLPLAVLAFGVFDQTTPGDAPNFAYEKSLFVSDATFVHQAEQMLPPDAKVFQIPIIPFPESIAPGRMHDYDHLRGFLHARHLKFSYGAIKGRNDWQLRLVGLPTDALERVIRSVGYDAIWIDRFGFTDDARQLQQDLDRILGPPALESPDKRLVLYRLDRRSAKHKPEPLLPRDLALTPFNTRVTGPVGPQERDGEDTVHTVFDHKATILVDNPAGHPRRTIVRFGVSAIAAGGTVTLNVGKASTKLRLTQTTAYCDVALTVAAKSMAISLTYDGPPGSLAPLTTLPPQPAAPFFKITTPASWDNPSTEPKSTIACPTPGR